MILLDLLLVILAQFVTAPGAEGKPDPLSTIQAVSASNGAPASLPPAPESAARALRVRGSQG